jgi:glycosyltransferase involved in cell wall biosynthesis
MRNSPGARFAQHHAKHMATVPYFIFSPSTILSLSGLLRGPDPTTPTPAEDWRSATVDVVIPALNEAENIVLCLESVARQTFRPRRIILVDDGSSDGTVVRARLFCSLQQIDLTIIQRRAPIGKTPTIKRQAREFDSDVEFILDADTVLESDNYIERTVQELYQAVGIASACGVILPQRRRDRRRSQNCPEIAAFNAAYPLPPATERGRISDLRRGMTNAYREVLYLFLQRVVYRGQMAFFGTMTNPVGCAVAYRRKYVRALFDYISPILGDDLTNSEDIFIGFSMLNEGYRNIQLIDVQARTVEPEVQRLPRQVYLWSSSFLQSCYYFDPLVRSPFRAIKRWLNGSGGKTSRAAEVRVPQTARAGAGSTSFLRAIPVAAGLGPSIGTGLHLGPTDLASRVDASGAYRGALHGMDASDRRGERRLVNEPYRQGFGRALTESYGRPAGWSLLMSAIEKVFFPTSLLIMLILRWWEALAVTVACETAICVAALAFVMKGRRLEYILKAVAVTPIRYALLGSELVTIGRFASDLWITNNRKWRK